MKGQLQLRQVECRQCSTVFVPEPHRYAKAKFCSPRCWYDFRLRDRKRKCKQCGAEFEAKPPLTKASKYCSRRCLLLSRGSIKQCRHCGKEYQSCPSVRVQYCSWKCYSDDNYVANEPKKCQNCGKDFVKRDAATTGKSRFCSQSCVFKYWKKHRHPMWRGERLQDRGADWPEARDSARKRDGELCHRCGRPQKGQALSVDHIVPYRLVMRLRKADPELPTPNVLANLISLCRSCHTHKTGYETMLLRGDVMGFIAWTKLLIDLDKILDALHLYGLLPRGFGSNYLPPDRKAAAANDQE